jgi:predicted nucleotidyltransferase component of viral defense system
MLHLETVSSSTLGLLKNLQSIKQLSGMRLVGGTSLALQKGHRISEDLDLFGFNIKEDNVSVLAALKAEGLKIDIRKQTSNMLIMMIENVKVDMVNYPYPWIDKAISESEITLAGKKDIAAMKLSAITNRGTKKDFVDLFYLLNDFTLSEMIGFYNHKYPDASLFMLLKSLNFFDDAEENEMPTMLDNSFTWEQMKTKIEKEVLEQINRY